MLAVYASRLPDRPQVHDAGVGRASFRHGHFTFDSGIRDNSKRMKKAAFIDRDGTLIEEVNFLSRVDDLRLFAYTANAVAELRSNGFNIFVVTNQSGIGRDLYTVDDMNS